MGSRGMGRVNGWHNYEELVHWVEITRLYWMAETPVTQAQFAAFLPGHENGFPGRPTHPAENLTWDEAGASCRWLWVTPYLRSQLPSGCEGVDLPTEAQWERARRGPDEPEKGCLGHLCEYHTGDGESALRQAGWYGEELGKGSTHPVGQKEPNGWGLRDLHGNVWEWCRDWWHDHPYVLREDGVQDPEITAETPGSDPSIRVVRGGSWNCSPRGCRSAFRDWRGPSYRNLIRGFRPVLFCLAAFPGPAEPAA